MSRDTIAIPLGFFLLAVLSHLFIFHYSLEILGFALILTAVIFEMIWASLPSERFSRVGLMINVIAIMTGLLLVELFTLDA